MRIRISTSSTLLRSSSVAGALLVASALAAPGAVRGLELVDLVTRGVEGIVNLSQVGGVAITPDGRYVYAPAGLTNRLFTFRRAEADGTLTYVRQLVVEQDPIAALVSPDGRHLYVSHLGGDALSAYAVNAVNGQLSLIAVYEDGVGGLGGLNGAAGLAFSPDGNQLYVAATADSAITVFARDAASGALTFVQEKRDGVAGNDGLGGAITLEVSPDGKNLYAGAGQDDALAVFSRNATNGQLTFQAAYFDGVAGVDGLDDPSDVAVSPDGRFVYTASRGDNRAQYFERGATGLLTPRGSALSGLFFLSAVEGVFVSGDGARGYLVQRESVRAYARDQVTGKFLTAGAEVIADGLDGLSGFAVMLLPAMSSDGRHLVAGVYDATGAVAVFELAPPSRLYLDDGRFTVDATYTLPNGTSGTAVPAAFTADTGAFSFLNPDNAEIVIKVLDGCALNDRRWVFAGGLTNVAVEITVTDTRTGAARVYTNPQGTAFAPIQDTAALDSCP